LSKKRFPLIVMLIAGAIAVIRTYFLHYTIEQKLISVFITLLIFYALGCIFTYIVGRFERQNEEEQKREEERLAEEQRLAEEAEAQKRLDDAEDISTAEGEDENEAEEV